MHCLSVEETGHSLALRPVAAPRRVGEIKQKQRHWFFFFFFGAQKEQSLFSRRFLSPFSRAPSQPLPSLLFASKSPSGSSSPSQRGRGGSRGRERGDKARKRAREAMAAAKLFCCSSSRVDRRKKGATIETPSIKRKIKTTNLQNHELTCTNPCRPGRGGGRRGRPPCRGRWRGAT